MAEWYEQLLDLANAPGEYTRGVLEDAGNLATGEPTNWGHRGGDWGLFGNMITDSLAWGGIGGAVGLGAKYAAPAMRGLGSVLPDLSSTMSARQLAKARKGALSLSGEQAAMAETAGKVPLEARLAAMKERIPPEKWAKALGTDEAATEPVQSLDSLKKKAKESLKIPIAPTVPEELAAKVLAMTPEEKRIFSERVHQSLAQKNAQGIEQKVVDPTIRNEILAQRKAEAATAADYKLMQPKDDPFSTIAESTQRATESEPMLPLSTRKDTLASVRQAKQLPGWESQPRPEAGLGDPFSEGPPIASRGLTETANLPKPINEYARFADVPERTKKELKNLEKLSKSLSDAARSNIERIVASGEGTQATRAALAIERTGLSYPELIKKVGASLDSSDPESILFLREFNESISPSKVLKRLPGMEDLTASRYGAERDAFAPAGQAKARTRTLPDLSTSEYNEAMTLTKKKLPTTSNVVEEKPIVSKLDISRVEGLLARGKEAEAKSLAEQLAENAEPNPINLSVETLQKHAGWKGDKVSTQRLADSSLPGRIEGFNPNEPRPWNKWSKADEVTYTKPDASENDWDIAHGKTSEVQIAGINTAVVNARSTLTNKSMQFGSKEEILAAIQSGDVKVPTGTKMIQRLETMQKRMAKEAESIATPLTREEIINAYSEGKMPLEEMTKQLNELSGTPAPKAKILPGWSPMIGLGSGIGFGAATQALSAQRTKQSKWPEGQVFGASGVTSA